MHELFEEHTHVFSGHGYEKEPFRYRLLRPEHAEPGEQYPLVLFLHGAGERGDDNRAQLKYLPELMATGPYRQAFPCFLVSPQCRAGRWWIPRAEDKPGGEQLEMALEILDSVEKSCPIDPRRVYLTGLSMGGFGCWNLAAKYPERFAAVVPICGGGNAANAGKLVDIPIWAVHGAEDDVVRPELSRAMIEAVRAAGGHPHYTELAGVAHDSWTPAYTDPDGVIPWMFQQVHQCR